MGRVNLLEYEDWGRLAQAVGGSSKLAIIKDFPWSRDVLPWKEKIDLHGRLIHDGCSGLKSPSFIVLVELLKRPNAASITDLDLR